jgi:hypothetical protein
MFKWLDEIIKGMIMHYDEKAYWYYKEKANASRPSPTQ